MTGLPRRLLQAFQVNEQSCRARPSSIVWRALQIPLRPPVASFAPSALPAGIRNTSTVHTTSSFHANKKHEGGEASDIIFAANQPAELPNRISGLSAWTISSSKMGITRQFTFPTFSAAWRFMSLVADECKAKRHHPSWSNLYNQVTVEWTTHKPKGLSMKDVEMAEFCDRTAEQIGIKMQDRTTGTASLEGSSSSSR